MDNILIGQMKRLRSQGHRESQGLPVARAAVSVCIQLAGHNC